MKKLYTLLFMLQLVVQLASAQQTLFVISQSGKLSAYTANKVSFDSEPLTFTYGEVADVTENGFASSFSVGFKSQEFKSLNQAPEVGICISDFNESPTITDGMISLGTSLKEYSFHVNSLLAGTTYYYRAFVKLEDAVYYGDVQKETTLGTKPTENVKVINGHRFVDLGLPSGLLWAETNIGALCAADNGNYFAWGEVVPKTLYYWDNYKFGEGLSKYNPSDGKTVLDKEDDAAYVNWGSSCRMPTIEEFSELTKSGTCTWSWTSMTTSTGTSISGYKVISTKNGNSIFFPTSGLRNYDYYYNQGTEGSFWSSTLYTNNVSTACNLYFVAGYYNANNHENRGLGYPVRPVANP